MFYPRKEAIIGLYFFFSLHFFLVSLLDVISYINIFFSLHFFKTWQQEANIGIYIFFGHNKLTRVIRLYIFLSNFIYFFHYNFRSTSYRTRPDQRPVWIILANFLSQDQTIPKTLQFSLQLFVATFFFFTLFVQHKTLHSSHFFTYFFVQHVFSLL